MNCTEAKKIPITHYLNTIGITPTELKNGSAWYCSPFRNETKPSFKVDRQNNIWYDFGTGTGGNVLDLVMNLNKTGISGALIILQKPDLSKPHFSFSEQQEDYSQPASIEIKHVQPLQHPALIEYLKSRKITPAKAVNYTQEAHYTTYKEQVKPLFAIAFKNDKSGFELRNGFKTEKFPNGFKGTISPKAVTTIKGNYKTANMFEGFIDFLSALEYYQTAKPAGTSIILNSVSNLATVLNTLNQYDQINLYLDNDTAGNNTAESIINTHQKVKDYSKIIYPGNKDFNEFICKKISS